MSTSDKKPCVLLCVTGCIAAYKACEILRLLQKANVRVKVLMTKHACEFVGPATFRALTNERVAIDLFDNPDDPIHHISLAKEADLVLVAPATANIMAKVATGIADDLMSTTLLATRAAILMAPAMNTGMWMAPATQGNLQLLLKRGVSFVGPDCGRLACGDEGAGKLAPIEDIVHTALDMLSVKQELKDERVLITAAGTQEAIDPVRYIGNRSSGTFGYALASAAKRMGAKVVLVSGPSALTPPEGVSFVPVVSAAEMYKAVDAYFDEASLLVCAAAVADYTPKYPADHKLKKAHEHLSSIELTETQDILAAMSSHKGKRIVVGFAAETDNLRENALAKLRSKGCDAIVANDVSRLDSGFDSETDAVLWVTESGVEDLGCHPKSELAYDILRRAAAIKESPNHSCAEGATWLK